jgi:hypothetical protein
LANLIQKIALLLGVGVICGRGAEFSHRVHLGLKLQCVTCHASAPASTRVEDSNLPKIEICQSCHTGGDGKARKLEFTIKQMRQTNLKAFSHQQHLKMGNVAPLIARAIDTKSYLSAPGDIRRHLNGASACTACHRGMAESDAVTRAAYPQMADCLVCHTKVDPPFSCSTCHADGPHLKPANHTPDLLDRHTTGKLNLDKSTCAVCHGRKFACLGCHQ